MKKLNSFLIATLFLFAGSVFAQDMTPPAPIESALLNSMEGTWVSNPYEFMGSTMTDVVTQKMILNGQFLEIDVKTTATNGFVYEALIVIAPTSDGTLQGWGFDVFGKSAMTTYTGSWKENTVYVAGKSSWGTESRNISMQGNIMIQNVIFKMHDASDKAPDKLIEITYTKQ